MNIIETNIQWTKSLASRKATNYIALHHAAAKSASVYDVDSWHKDKGWAGIGYHFYVRKDGSIYRGRPLHTIGAHATGKNEVSIGICVEGDYTSEHMPDVQKRAIAELLHNLKSDYPNAQIVGHGEIGASSCPGKNFPLAELKDYNKILNTEEQSMSNKELCEQIKKLEERIETLEKEREKVYHYGIDLPEEFYETMEKLMNKGYFKGAAPDDLDLSESMLRVLVVNDRAGLYDR